jgi:hypothetical protein
LTGGILAGFRSVLLQGAALALCLGATSAAAAPEVLRLRMGDHGDWTRLVLDLSDVPRFSVTQPGGTGPLTLRVADLSWRGAAPVQLSGTGLIDRVTSDAGGGPLRIETAVPARLRRSFVLAPEAGKPYRLVIDVERMPEAPVPPIAQMPPPAPPITEPTPGAPAAVPEDQQFADIGWDETEAAERAAPTPGKTPLQTQAPPRPEPAVRTTLSGVLEDEMRLFTQKGAAAGKPGAPSTALSFTLEPKLEVAWAGGVQTVTIAPFVRVDAKDGRRTHVDLREARWIGVFGDWEIRAGFDKLFWGVTESVHLVDIINQTDLVEDIDTEDKLGQPLVAIAYQGAFGRIRAFFMPYFRERTFAGPKGRPRPALVIDVDHPVYQSRHKRWRPSWALRWAAALGPVDLGLAHFSGTGREPRLVPGLNPDGAAVLVPHYDLIDQTSLDVQATLGAWLWKFEGISVRSRGQRYNALAGGFEYSFYGLGGSGTDLGVLAEYLYDDRGAAGPSPYEDDLFVALRWVANDRHDSEILAGAIFDLGNSATIVNIEASRRLGADWRISFDARLLLDVPAGDPLFVIRADDFIQLRLGRYF